MKSVVALIPVKGNSERVAKKNIRNFANTNLLELKLSQLERTSCFSDIIISSEDKEILNKVKSLGFNFHERDPKYSTSDIPMSSVYSYIASEIHGEHIAWVNVTNPLVESKFYQDAVTSYSEMSIDYDCMPSAYKLQEYLIYREKPVNFSPNPWPKSQDLDGMYSLSFAINQLKREDMISWGSTIGNKPKLFVLPQDISIDIDTEEDFNYAQFLYKKRFNLE